VVVGDAVRARGGARFVVEEGSLFLTGAGSVTWAAFGDLAGGSVVEDDFGGPAGARVLVVTAVVVVVVAGLVVVVAGVVVVVVGVLVVVVAGVVVVVVAGVVVVVVEAGTAGSTTAS